MSDSSAPAVPSRLRARSWLALLVLVGLLSAFVAPAPARAENNPAHAGVQSAQTWYVYVKAGETVSSQFVKASSVSGKAFDPTIVVTAPDGSVQSDCAAIVAASPKGTACSFTATATTTGVWSVQIPAPNGFGSGKDQSRAVMDWDITVSGSGGSIPGRVWTESYAQTDTGAMDLSLWYLTEYGYIYRIDRLQMEGINSRFRADAFGNVDPATCASAHHSTMSGADRGTCTSTPYKMFFAAPASDLPASVTLPDGTQTWLVTPPQQPTLDDVAFTPSASGSRAGTIAVTISKFEGTATIEVDTNGDGAYGGVTDRSFQIPVVRGHGSMAFDGRDAAGMPIPSSTPIHIRASSSEQAEVHFTDDDVEIMASGVIVTRINGPMDGTQNRIFWDDSYIDTEAGDPQAAIKCSRTAQLTSGPDGVDSSAGVHGWDLGDCSWSGAPAANAGTNDTTSGGTWGNSRMIDNWASVVTDLERELAVPAAVPGLQLTKRADTANVHVPAKAGDVVKYSFTATNSGGVDLTGVTIADQLAGLSALGYSWPGAPGTLKVGQTVTATASYAVTQADIDAGHVANTGVAHGKDPSNGDVPSNPASTDTPLTSAPALQLTKTADAAAVTTPSQAGQKVTYHFTATNTGNVSLANVAIADQLSGLSPLSYAWPGAAGSLAPGQSVTATATYTVSQADIDAGHVANAALATGTAPGGSAIPSNRAATDTPLTASPALTLTKSADTSAVSDPSQVGQTITYRFTTANTGNVTISGIAVTDPLAGLSAVAYLWPGAAGVLAPGQSVSGTATYRITQADLDSGHVTNTAVANGSDPSGSPVVSNEASTDTPFSGVPSLALTKSADTSALTTPSKVGEVITYRLVATNTGNVTLASVAIADQLAGISPLTYTWPGAAGTLAPGQSVAAVATYEVKQADIDAGAVANTATASGTDPAGVPVPSDPASTVTPLTAAPGLQLTKTADASALTSPARPGDPITYRFTATNTGNVALSHVAISDRLRGLSALTYAWPGAAGALQPGASVAASATYGVQQADIDAGHVANTALAQGTTPSGADIASNEAATDTPLETSRSLVLTKTADASALSSPPKAGEVITYRFSAKNAGNVALTDVAITDRLAGLSALAYSWPAAAGTLAPGQEVTATATYRIVQADIDAGHVANAALAVGTDPSGVSVPSEEAATDTPLVAASGLVLVKAADASAVSTPARVGEVVTYRFTATNTGNTTLTGVVIDDPLSGLSALTYAWPGAQGTLAPGASVTATATYGLTQADLDAGHLANTARAKGADPNGGDVPSTPAVTDTPLVGSPGLNLRKTADASAVRSPARPGQVITYLLTATNTGTVTLTGVSIADPLRGLSTLEYAWPRSAGTLQPGQSATATASYVITQADIDAGHVLNTALASAVDPGGDPVSSGPDEADVPLLSTPALELVKTADPSALSTPAHAGELIAYAFTATNTGNVTLHEVDIADPLAGLSELSYAWPGTAGTLSPGEAVTATATYAITQADIDAGHVANAAVARSVDPAGADVPSTPGETDTPLVVAPALRLEKAADDSAVSLPATAGQPIGYTLSATNTGNVTLTGVTIEDGLDGLPALTYVWPSTPGTLAPGETATATADYAVTQADIDAGHVANRATATGVDPSGGTVPSDPAETDTPLISSPGLDLVKTADASAVGAPAQEGDVITYSFVVSNTGTVTLTAVTIQDEMPGLSPLSYAWPGRPGELLPGEAVTATATYALRKGDLSADSIHNHAVASAVDPTGKKIGSDVSGTSTSVVPAPVQAEPVVMGVIAETGGALAVAAQDRGLPIGLMALGMLAGLAALGAWLRGRRSAS